MKTGIIIICYNNESDIDMDRCVKHLNNETAWMGILKNEHL